MPISAGSICLGHCYVTADLFAAWGLTSSCSRRAKSAAAREGGRHSEWLVHLGRAEGGPAFAFADDRLGGADR